jgi:hypothetical protein
MGRTVRSIPCAGVAGGFCDPALQPATPIVSAASIATSKTGTQDGIGWIRRKGIAQPIIDLHESSFQTLLALQHPLFIGSRSQQIEIGNAHHEILRLEIFVVHRNA